jgi:two-component system CheB/CheR fusion protein
MSARSKLDVDFRLLRSDGVYRWMRYAGAPFLDEEGKFAGFVGIASDAEDRKRFESELLESDRRKDEFVAMLAHELRNPVAPIRNAVSVMLRSGNLDPTALWAVGIVNRQTEVLSRLLDDLLETARVASGKVTIAVAPVEVGVIVDRAVEMTRPLVDSRRQRLSIDQPDPAMRVEGDLVRLVQVISNLLNNASKYSEEGGEIAIAVAREGSHSVIRVTDNGVGMAADFVPHVFDLFAQADGSLERTKGGLGLGLTLAARLVKLHGGTIEASSPGLGLGSQFTVRLPLCSSAPVLQSKPAPAAGSTAPLRILVVDDNEDAAESLAVLLRLDGNEVMTAPDAAIALQMAEQEVPDAVILDIGLPGMDGYELARILRGHAATSGVLLIAVTGYGQPEVVDRAREAGCDHHFVKPVDVDRLLAILKSQRVA